MAEHKPKANLTSSGFLALRTPFLPFDELLAWADGLESASALDGMPRLEEALRADHARLRERLRAVVERPEVREALFVASPSLDAQLPAWLNEPDSEKGQKVERTLVKYFARMAGRATPFGLFAGCSVGVIGNQTRLRLAERAGYQRHARLDMDYLVALAESLDRDRALRETLTYFPNSSLYRVPGRLRYQEYRTTDKGRTHHAVSIEESPYLRAVLERAVAGATVAQLAAALRESAAEATREEAEAYVHELIDTQVLASDLSPAVTGAEPIHGLVEKLRQHPAAAPVAERLSTVKQELDAINAAGLGIDSGRYRRIAEMLQELPAKVNPEKLFQVDMVKPATDLSLDERVVQDIQRGVELLHRLSRPAPQEELTRFRQAFAERYQGQGAPPYEVRWVPLLEVLDEDMGIGFGGAGNAMASSLLDDLNLPLRIDSRVPWGDRESFLLRKLAEALSCSEQQIVLQPAEIEALASPKPSPLPDALAVMVNLAAQSESALDQGEYQIHLESTFGPSGAVMLGRFCHADPALQKHVEEHLHAEEALHPDALFAEIVHLPEEGRIGNILARPRLRDYEIVYLGQSGAPLEKQIPITDLLVTATGEEILLRSRRFNRRVIPRLTSAHNFIGRGKGLYRFLCLLQSQGQARAGWDWGPLANAPFLPRVVYDKFVLSLARWSIGKEALKSLRQAEGAEGFRLMQLWRQRLCLPRWIALADGDNELPIDLDNVMCVEAFIDLVKKREQVSLVEMFPQPDRHCAGSAEGRFVHEIIVPFVKQVVTEATEDGSENARDASSVTRPASFQRSISPGSDWLYVKLYSGSGMTDELLRDVVRPVTRKALDSRAATGWFFIRYGDPDWHLRLRYQGEPRRLLGEVLPALQLAVAPLLQDGRVWRMQIDTYEREVERYGGPSGMAAAEKLFQADSEAILRLSHLLAEDARGDLRWRLTLYGMDRLLEDLGFDLGAKRKLLSKLSAGFGREFHAEGALKHELSGKFRTQRQVVEAALAVDSHADEPLAFGKSVLQERSRALGPTLAELRDLQHAGELSLPLPELASSFLHMHANRLLRSSQRAQELVLYEFLHRLYESQAAREPAAFEADKERSKSRIGGRRRLASQELQRVE